MLRVVGHAGVGLLAVFCAALSAASCGPSAVETGQASDGDFYKGKPVSIIVGSGAGGGGLVAANDIFSAAAKDGTVVGLFHEVQMIMISIQKALIMSYQTNQNSQKKVLFIKK